MERAPYEIQVTLGLPGPLEALLAKAMGDVASLFPNTLRAIAGLAEAAQRRWIAYASGALPLPDGKRLHRVSGQYADSIQIRVENPDGAILYVIYSDDPKASWLEYGTSAWDMKKVLETSRKARISKKGKRYLIIPFRWGTPGTLGVGVYRGREMPEPVHSWWASRESSFIVGSYEAKSPLDGGPVTRYVYQWGSRLTPRDIRELGLDPNTAPGRHMVGMVKMQNPEDSRLGSQYLTFRTMSEDSPGWQHPGLPAYRPAGATFDWLKTIYPRILEAALDADVQRLKRLAEEG